MLIDVSDNIVSKLIMGNITCKWYKYLCINAYSSLKSFIGDMYKTTCKVQGRKS